MLRAAAGNLAGAGGVAWSTTAITAGAQLSDGDSTVTKISGVKIGAMGDSAFGKTSGAYYIEFEAITATGPFLGCGLTWVSAYLGGDIGAFNATFGYHSNGGRYFDNSYSSGAYSTYTDGDIIGMAVDIDNETIEFFKNGVSQGETSIVLDSGNPYVPGMSANADGDGFRLVPSSENTYSTPSGFSNWE